MKFEVDKQTLKDLEIFDAAKNGTSVFRLFNYTRYLGGKRKLFSLLTSPSADIDEVTDRKDAIIFFQKYFPSGLMIDKDSLDFAEYYYKHSRYPTHIPSRFVAIERMWMSRINMNNEYYLVESGVNSIVKLIKAVHQFSVEVGNQLKKGGVSKLLQRRCDEVSKLSTDPRFAEIINLNKTKAYDVARFDYLFRYEYKDQVRFFIDLIYEYDAFYSVVEAAKEYKLSFPEILPSDDNCLEIEGLFHLFVPNAVPNDIRFEKSSNLLFVTGPNMAGKSTFLKALGLSVYLAHIGFPVPAQKMKLSILTGLCTTINISDNLSSGYSHFYAEVMRIKDVAYKLEANNKMLVIFDELFRGTNVKDAYDGTLAVVSSLAKIKSSFFVISTHIVEVAEVLNTNKNINFCSFEIKDVDGHPVYTYKLKDGVSDIRLGMYIIRKEGVIELIDSINENK